MFRSFASAFGTPNARWTHGEAVRGGFSLEIDMQKRTVHATYNGADAGVHKILGATNPDNTAQRRIWIEGVPLVGVRGSSHQPRVDISIGMEDIETHEIVEYDD